MTTLNENNLNDQDENLSDSRHDDGYADQSGGNTDDSHMGAHHTNIDNSNSFSNSDLTPAPGPDDDEDDDDDSLVPIEDDDDDDDSLNEDDDDIIPGTDMDSDDPDEDDNTENSSGVNRSTMGDMGSNVSARNQGRKTGRMIDHEPGTGGI
jgi:hypothetical protein